MLFRFEEIREATGGTFLNPPEGDGVDSVTTDSRIAAPNSLFIAIPGEQFDGHDFLDTARKQGAVLLCVERARLSKLPPGAPAIVVDSAVRAYQNLAKFHRLRFPVKADIPAFFLYPLYPEFREPTFLSGLPVTAPIYVV